MVERASSFSLLSNVRSSLIIFIVLPSTSWSPPVGLTEGLLPTPLDYSALNNLYCCSEVSHPHTAGQMVRVGCDSHRLPTPLGIGRQTWHCVLRRIRRRCLRILDRSWLLPQLGRRQCFRPHTNTLGGMKSLVKHGNITHKTPNHCCCSCHAERQVSVEAVLCKRSNSSQCRCPSSYLSSRKTQIVLPTKLLIWLFCTRLFSGLLFYSQVVRSYLGKHGKEDRQ